MTGSEIDGEMGQEKNVRMWFLLFWDCGNLIRNARRRKLQLQRLPFALSEGWSDAAPWLD